MAKSQFKEMICLKGLKVKESGEITGLIATTHPDRVGDILSKKALDQMVNYINNNSSVGSEQGAYRSVSLYHDWITEKDPSLDEAGFLKPTARVVELPDGHFGVEVDAVVNEFYRGDLSADEIKFRIENGGIGGFSIEYDTNDTHCKTVNYNGDTYRFIDELTDFAGVGFARSRLIANPMAVIYKEIEMAVKEDKMEETEIKQVSTDVTIESAMEQKKSEEAGHVPSHITDKCSCKDGESCSSCKPGMKEAVSEPTSMMTDEEAKKKSEAQKAYELEQARKGGSDVAGVKEVEVEVKEVSVKEILESKELKDAISHVTVENKVIKQTKEDKKMEGSISVKEMNEAISKNDLLSFKEAASKYFRENPSFDAQLKSHGIPLNTTVQMKCDGTKIRIVGGLQAKDILTSGSNASTYTQAAVEFADVYVPGIVDTFNNQLGLFGALAKKDNVMGGPSYGWRISTSRKSSLSVDPDNTTVATSYMGKLKLQTPFKVYRNGVSVADYTMYHSRAAIGDLMSIEVEKATRDLLKDINIDLFTEQVDSTTKVLGLEAVADSAGNTTLYGLTRSATNRLAPDAAADTYVAVGGALTTAVVRNGISKVEIQGAMRQNLMIVVSPKQRDALFELLDAQQQLFVTPEFGFSGAIRFDGIPVLVDADMPVDQLTIVDKESAYLVLSKMPQLVGLAKVGASEEAYVETYLAFVYENPRRIHMLDTLS